MPYTRSPTLTAIVILFLLTALSKPGEVQAETNAATLSSLHFGGVTGEVLYEELGEGGATDSYFEIKLIVKTRQTSLVPMRRPIVNIPSVDVYLSRNGSIYEHCNVPVVKIVRDKDDLSVKRIEFKLARSVSSASDNSGLVGDQGGGHCTSDHRQSIGGLIDSTPLIQPNDTVEVKFKFGDRDPVSEMTGTVVPVT